MDSCDERGDDEAESGEEGEVPGEGTFEGELTEAGNVTEAFDGNEGTEGEHHGDSDEGGELGGRRSKDVASCQSGGTEAPRTSGQKGWGRVPGFQKTTSCAEDPGEQRQCDGQPEGPFTEEKEQGEDSGRDG